MTDFNVEHHEQSKQFIIKLVGGQVAQLSYRLGPVREGRREVDFFSTNVPDDFRGKGLAGLLVDRGFAWADKNDLAIKTSCWYAEVKLKRREKTKG